MQGQEASLLRASSLYQSLRGAESFYKKQSRSPIFADDLLYSPEVQVFRDDDGNLLAEPYTISVISAVAPNASAIAPNARAVGQHHDDRVADALDNRIDGILALAHGHRTLVLGAWGCGEFGNDPYQVAAIFRDRLAGKGFERVVLAVIGEPAYSAFRYGFRRAISNS